MNNVLEPIVKAHFCHQCGAEISGRADKRFCDGTCRGRYNNNLQRITSTRIRNINRALGKNRRILEGILIDGESSVKISMEELLLKGFNFKFNTHSIEAKTGKTYIYCYDLGYLPLEGDLYLIVREK
jgi:hypothetical protein